MTGETDEWEHLAGQILKAAEFRDRLIVVGAAGTLLLSITFLHQIAPKPVPWTLHLLIVTWVVLLISLATSLGSMDTTERALRGQHSGDETSEKKWNQRTRKLNYISLVGLVVGVTMFAVFAAVNLPWQEVEDAGRQRGQEVSETTPAPQEASTEAEGTRNR